MKQLVGWLTIGTSLGAAAIGQVTVGLPFFGVLLGAAVVASFRD